MSYRRENHLLRLVHVLWEELRKTTDTTQLEYEIRAAGIGWALPSWDHHHDDEKLTVDQLGFELGYTPSAIRNWPTRYGLKPVNGKYRWRDIRELMESRGTKENRRLAG